MSAVGAAVDAVRARIAAAANRAGNDPDAVLLIAVTKGVDVGRIVEAIAAGVTDIGENRVQEAIGKSTLITQPVRRHLLGHLQSNKARRAAEIFDVVHSVDGDRIARALGAHRPPGLGLLDVLIEVELTGLPTRSGVTGAGAESVLRAVADVPGMRVLGLMTIAAEGTDAEAARPYFRHLRVLRDRLEQSTGRALPVLSMGMTGDFEVAVEEGATMVRVGRAIFGERRSERVYP